jgi:hypothetical protein
MTEPPILRVLVFTLVLITLSCSSFERMPPADHVVRAPISDRANVVLSNLVTEYGSADGRWKGCMSPGCTQIWAVQFGFRAGVRRDRDDVVAVGSATAERVSGEIRSLFWDALFGDVDENDPAVFGFPALLVSGALGRRGMDEFLFGKGLERVAESRRPEDAVRPRENAGLAALLAEVSRLMPERREEWLGRARAFAEGAAGDEILAFFAWAAVARASGEAADVQRAREAEKATPYRFDPQFGALTPPASNDEILSLHLAMVHGLADLALADGGSGAWVKAVTLLEYVLSDAYFDGRFLIHDRLGGEPSKDVCSGCNFMALYLVDRLYGDSFVIDPVPALPVRDWPEEERRQRTIDETFVLESAEAEFGRDGLDSEGLWLVKHATHDVRITLAYRTLPLEEIEPRGGVEVVVKRRGSDAEHPGQWTHGLPFDDDGVADMEHFYGFWPLTFTVRFTRGEDGGLSATIRLREDER